MRRVLAVAVAIMGLTGCTTAAQPSAPPTGNSTIRVVPTPAPANLILWVSNQSFDHPSVEITITIDGVAVVGQEFAVEGQHNWIAFPISAPAGDHELVADSSTGARHTQSFTLPEAGERYALVDYWFYDGEQPYFSWTISDEPLSFD